MENIESIFLSGTSIEELPDSFLNLTGLHDLILYEQGMLLRLPSSILMMPNLHCIDVDGYHLLPKQGDKPRSVVSSKVKSLVLTECNLTDESLPIVLQLFANLTILNLSMNNFTILPECVKEYHSLRSLNLDDCKHLEEIRGIPPNLKCLSTLNCESLNTSCRSMLLNQELHEVGGTMFCLPGTAVIPEWFEFENRGSSISFWFRNKLPSIALLCTSESCDDTFYGIHGLHLLPPTLSINGYKCSLANPFGTNIRIKQDHTYLFDLQLQDIVAMDEALLESEWNHAIVGYENLKMISLLKKSRIHIFKKESSMEDIALSSPYKKRKRIR